MITSTLIDAKVNFSEQELKEHLLYFLKVNEVSLDVFPFEWLCSTDFLIAPASTHWHGAYPGGLLAHSMNVAQTLIDLTKAGVTEPWERPESPIIIGLLHDAVKIGAYAKVFDQEQNKFRYVWNPLRHDKEEGAVHAQKSLDILRSAPIELTNEERLCIRCHMGAYEVDEWERFDAAIKTYPNVLWTHTADMIASKLMEG